MSSILEGEMWLHLFEMLCVIIVVAYFISRTKAFFNVHEGKGTVIEKSFLILLFGSLSIFGTLSGFEILGAPVNIRDLGPLVAGITCGPVVGGAAGIIGAVHRLSMGGFTCIPCSLATAISGFAGGTIYILNKRKMLTVYKAVLFAALFECFHLILVLCINTNMDTAVSIVMQVGGPVVFFNALGMFIFAKIAENHLEEIRTSRERDRYKDELERKRAELKIASEIQQQFLPKDIPPITGYDLAALSLPAREIGGDFYDIIPFGNQNHGLVIADVSGKSVPAALFMALSKITVRSTAVWHQGTAGTMYDANDLITHESDSGMFVTVFYGILDRMGERMIYTNAGHNPPIIFRKKEEQFETLHQNGMALGVMAGSEYGQDEVFLHPLDIIVFYTDGVTEAINQDEEQFGVERLKKVIRISKDMRSQQIIEQIQGAMQTFCKEEPQFDDITIMILKAEGDDEK